MSSRVLFLLAGLCLFSKPGLSESRSQADFEARIDAVRGQLRLPESKEPALKTLGEIGRDLASAAQAQPKAAWPHLLLGRVHLYREEPKEAVAELDKAASMTPDDYKTVYLQGYAHSMAGDTSGAIPILKRAVALDATKPAALEELAATYMDLKNPAAAKEAWLQASTLPEASPNDWKYIAAAMNALGQKDEAVPYLEKASTLEPDDPELHFNAGLGWSLREDNARALPHFEALVRLDPQDAVGWAKLVQVNQALGHTAARDAAREKVLALYRAGKTKAVDFGREQFSHNGFWVFASENFAPKPPFNVRLRFEILTGPRGKSVARYELESADGDQEYARNTGKLPPGGRVYTLDRMTKNSHETIAFLGQEPTYEELRQLVLDAMDKKVKPVSSSTELGKDVDVQIKK